MTDKWTEAGQTDARQKNNITLAHLTMRGKGVSSKKKKNLLTLGANSFHLE